MGLARGRAVLYSDGGGKRAAALNPIRGANRILRFFAGVARKDPALAAMAARPATVNGSGLRTARKRWFYRYDGRRTPCGPYRRNLLDPQSG
jgi:hypothetical protein